MTEIHNIQITRKSFLSPVASYRKRIKSKPILTTGRRKGDQFHKLRIILDGRDVTPKPLNPDLYAAHKERPMSIYNTSHDRLYGDTKPSIEEPSLIKSHSTVRFRTDARTIQGSSYRSSLLGTFDMVETGETLSGTEGTGDTSEEAVRVAGSSMDDESVTEAVRKLPSRVSLTLNETNTVFLLDIPSSTAIKDSDEGTMVEIDNESYEYLTEGKGRNRKMLNAEVQTVEITVKSRSTLCPRVKTKHGTSYVSVWEMYDTFQEVHESDEETEESDADMETTEETGHKLDEVASLDSYRMSGEEKQIQKLIKNPRFLEAVCVIERLLAANYYKEQQKIFRGMVIPDDFREDIEYKYRLNHLWTFANETTKGRSVNSMDWNPKNKDILAVGYGKFYFADQLTGLVLIWNIKNPVQPERQYNFQTPVTAVSFSKEKPMLLAVGFYDGALIVLNIASREKMIIGEGVPTYEPLWSVSWNYGQTQKKDEEMVCATYDDGKICAYSVQRKLDPFQLMRVAKADGKLKGYNAMKKCTNLLIPVVRYAAAYFVRWHPTNSSIYFVGTNEGVLHKCSLNYLNQHLDLFSTHEGPITAMKFSPFTSKIAATCGDDWHTRIWAMGISESLIDTYIGMNSVEDLDWSPSHSTIFVTIMSREIQIWDLQRKAYAPQSVTESPGKARCTKVQFTDSGRCLIVGDVDGNVHVFSLEDLPFAAFFQENMLFDAIGRMLSTNLSLLKKFNELRRKDIG